MKAKKKCFLHNILCYDHMSHFDESSHKHHLLHKSTIDYRQHRHLTRPWPQNVADSNIYQLGDVLISDSFAPVGSFAVAQSRVGSEAHVRRGIHDHLTPLPFLPQFSFEPLDDVAEPDWQMSWVVVMVVVVSVSLHISDDVDPELKGNVLLVN